MVYLGSVEVDSIEKKPRLVFCARRIMKSIRPDANFLGCSRQFQGLGFGNRGLGFGVLGFRD